VTDVRDRFASQLLTGARGAEVATVVRHLVAVQAQDLTAARLGVRARSLDSHASDIDARLNAGTLLVSWLNRGTLHLVASEDYRWLHALTTPHFTTANLTRLRQEGVSEEQRERGVATITEELAGGPRTRAQLRSALARVGVPVGGQAVPHLLMRATITGVCVRGPLVGAEQAFVLVDDWVPSTTPLPRDEALDVLGGRYLAAHAPADARDLAKWAGIPLGWARQALADTVGGNEGREQVTHDGLDDPVPDPVLLGPFDELLMGWASRNWVLGGHQDVVTSNGVFRPVILADGHAVGTWRRSGSTVTLQPWTRLSAQHQEALATEADDVRRFLRG
jgi:hypothetical protein